MEPRCVDTVAIGRVEESATAHLVGGDYSACNWVVTGICTTSMCLQIYLVYMIVRISPPAMKEYRPFLLSIAGWDLTLTTMEFGLIPDFLYPASCMVASGPFRYLGAKFSLFALHVAIFAMCAGMMQQNVSLAYRLVVCSQQKELKKKFLNWKTVCVIQLCTNGYILAFVAYLYTRFLNEEDKREYLKFWDNRTNSKDRPPPYNRNGTIACGEFWPPESIKYLLWMGGGMVVFIEVLATALSISIFAVLQMNKKYFSKQTRKMHIQLTALLIAQFLSPLVFMTAPIANILTNLVMTRTVDYWDKPVSGDLSMLTQTTSDIYVISFSLYGLMNAVLTVVFVAPYRQHLAMNRRDT